MIISGKGPCDEGVMRAPVARTAVALPAGVWILVATILGSSLSFIDGTVVNVALPTLQRELNATAADVQWVIEAYALFLCALILVGGSLGDRLGRRRVFAAGIAVFTVASIACGLAPSLLFLVIARAIQGIGGALLVPGSLAIISAAFDEQRRGRAIGTWSAFTTITSALGPVLGGWLIVAAGWRWIFFINVPLAILTLAVTFRSVPESREHDVEGPLDWLGAALATLGLGGLVFGLIESSGLGLASPVVVIPIVVGILSLVAFVTWEARSPAPMVSLALFRSRTFAGANLFTLLLYGGLGGALYFLPFTLQQVQGYSPIQAGASFLPFTLIIFGLSRWAGGLVPRVGAKLPLVIGPIIAALGFALFAVPGIGGSYWTTYFPAIVVLSLGMVLVIAPLTTAVMGAVPTDRVGVASGVNNAVSRTAGLLAIAVLNVVVVVVFANALQAQLAPLHLSAAAQQALEAQHTRLLATQIPPSFGSALTAEVHRALADAFLKGFRGAMLIGAALALLASGVAALLIEGKPVSKATAQTRAGPK